MNVLTQALSFVQSLFGKSILVYGFGWLFKLNPKFKNEGIPAATLVVNILVAALAAAAEAAGATTSPAAFVAATAAGAMRPDAIIFDVLLPQLIADGLYNYPRRLWSWLKARLGH